MPNIPNIPRAPLNAATSDVLYNELVDAVNDIQEWISVTSRTNGIPSLTGQPRIPEIFVGLITETPCSSSQSPYTDARYYVTRSQTKNGLTYGTGGVCTDLLLAQTDDFNGKLPVPGCVTATNLAELPPQLDAKGTSNGGGTHQLAQFTPVLVFAMPTRQNPMKKVYLFTSGGVLPKGQYQGMAFQMLTDNQSGWDWDLMHGLL
jgi:hypothetical protein